MTEPKPRWLVTCSCGYERECSDAWSASATAKLHGVHLGDKSVAHVVTVKKPGVARAAGEPRDTGRLALK